MHDLLVLLQNWIEEVSAHVKALDPHHLVLLGHSGVFGASTPDRYMPFDVSGASCRLVCLLALIALFRTL